MGDPDSFTPCNFSPMPPPGPLLLFLPALYSLTPSITERAEHLSAWGFTQQWVGMGEGEKEGDQTQANLKCLLL